MLLFCLSVFFLYLETGMNLYDLDGDLTYEMSIRVGTRHPYTRYGSVSPSNIHGALRNLQFMIRKYQGKLIAYLYRSATM